MSQNKIIETRGRPKKEQARVLSPFYKQKFSDNSAIIHASFLIYAFEVFIETKNEKRVGHKDGGFTIYDKIDNTYCFDNLNEVVEQWGLSYLLHNKNTVDLVNILPGIGPKIILKEVLRLIDQIYQRKQEGKTEPEIVSQLSDPRLQLQLDDKYPHMRFVPRILTDLKFEKNQRRESSSFVELIRKRVNSLWNPLMKILVYTILNSLEGKLSNRYFKPFFSDAENPLETYIGQLNLTQIVETIENISRKEIADSDEVYDGYRKYRQIENGENQRRVVAVQEPIREGFTPIGSQMTRPIIPVPNSKKIESSLTPGREQKRVENSKPIVLIGKNNQYIQQKSERDACIKQQPGVKEVKNEIIPEKQDFLSPNQEVEVQIKEKHAQGHRQIHNKEQEEEQENYEQPNN